MPPKNNFTLGEGQCYSRTPNGLSPLGGLYSVEDIEGEEPPLWPKENPYIAIKVAQRATLSVTLSAMRGPGLYALARFTVRLDKMIRTAKRLTHLAKYGKRLRTRKKNLNRLKRLEAKKKGKKTP